MFIHKLYYFFFSLVIASGLLLVYNWYKSYEFDNNPLSQELTQQIFEKKATNPTTAQSQFWF